MRVRVDEPGRDHEAVAVDGARRAVVDVADGDDAATLHADVGAPTGCTGAVDDPTVAQDEIEHGRTFPQGMAPLRWPIACAASYGGPGTCS